jgi:cytochrome b561
MNSLTKHRYDTISMSLHWLAAIAVVAAFALGPGDFGRLADSGVDPGTRLDIVAHESIGLFVFLLTAVRLVWVAVRPAPPSATGPDWSNVAAVAVRIVLWILLLATPVTALLTLAGDGRPLTLLAGLRLDAIPFLGDAILWIAGLHAAAALVHHFIRRDNVLKSMLPRRRA